MYMTTLLEEQSIKEHKAIQKLKS